MLEDTNSLDGAHILLKTFTVSKEILNFILVKQIVWKWLYHPYPAVRVKPDARLLSKLSSFYSFLGLDMLNCYGPALMTDYLP